MCCSGEVSSPFGRGESTSSFSKGESTSPLHAPSAFIKFLGTAGTRFVVSKQTRASGGIWLFLNGVHLHLDPGPGALVKSIQSHLNPQDLSAIILSHRHLDHSNDVNIMIEAMTNGGTLRKGTLFCPQDALDNDPVVFNYILNYVRAVEILREGTRYRIVGDSRDETVGSQEKIPPGLEFDVPVRNIHGSVQAYGMRFFLEDTEEQREMQASDNPCECRMASVPSVSTIGYIGDTKIFDGLINAYQGVDLLIINAVIENPMSGVDHLCVEDVIALINGVSPKLAILTHFGRSMLNAQPDSVAEKIAAITQVNTIASSDGMEVRL